MTIKRSTIALAILSLSASPVFADKVHLTNGQIIEGKVKKDGQTYVVTTDAGTTTRIAASEVITVDECPTPRDRYDEKVAQLAPDDLAAQLDLAKWCDGIGLKKEARTHYERVVEIDADNAEARKALGFVRQGDGWVSKDAERTAHAKDEAAKKQKTIEATKLLHEAAATARSLEARMKALTAFKALPEDIVKAVLLKECEDGPGDTRKLCADLLGNYAGDFAVRALARRVVLDERPDVQGMAVASLTSIAHPETGVLFAQALTRDSPEQRLRAAYALRRFPHKSAIPALMNMGTTSNNDDGVHRSYASYVTQRAYISDWELTSGGTAVVVVEVAAPIIQTIQEGVVLEVNARYVLDVSFEQGVREKTLEKLSGDKKSDMDEWKAWWKKAEPDFELSEEAQKTLKALGPKLALEMKKELAAKEEAARKKGKKLGEDAPK